MIDFIAESPDPLADGKPSNPGTGGNGPWGWSIDISDHIASFDDPDFTLTCDIYAAAGQCDFTKDGAANVGTFVISQNSMQWNFQNAYGASDAHLYSGVCPYNDGGDHLDTGACDEDVMRQYARVPGQYTLKVSSFDPLENQFAFDANNHESNFRGNSWDDYKIFPLNQPNRTYFSAHATVCPLDTGVSSITDYNNSVGAGSVDSLSSATVFGITLAVFVAITAVGLLVYTVKKKSSGEESTVSDSSSRDDTVLRM